MDQLVSQIKAEADTLGFSLLSATNLSPPPHWDRFQSWLEAGRYASMGYLARPDTLARRRDPTLILPQARSCLVLAAAYPNPARLHAPDLPPGQGRLAAYATLPDYHRWIPERLGMLVARTEVFLGRSIVFRACTDSAPVLERDLAARAGLGWVGRNGCLIHPRFGSHFFLAELFWDVEMDLGGQGVPDRCGSCRRCLDACPTGCILPDRTLDARRCISYLTIEHRGAVDPGMRDSLGGWVFGCDACQTVCPWNRRSEPAREGPVIPARVDLTRALDLDQEGFDRRYGNLPVARAKREGFLRNIAYALGTQPLPEALPALARALAADPSPVVRAACAWALGRYGPPAVLALARQQGAEMDPSVQAEIRQALQPG